jgi:hypothetical protein
MTLLLLLILHTQTRVIQVTAMALLSACYAAAQGALCLLSVCLLSVVAKQAKRITVSAIVLQLATIVLRWETMKSCPECQLY